jgi:ParB-like chromosome segregation protein Spo0J
MKKLELTEIRRDEEAQKAQMREKGVNPARVTEYAEAMESYAGWGEFPPIDVFFDGTDYWPGDGWQRLAAAEKAGLKGGIPANVKKGGLRQAILFAAGANAEHGEPRTNADKRLAVSTLLKDDEWFNWSDTVIAQRVRVSQPFVSKLRRDLEDLVPAKKGDTQNVLSTRPQKRVGRDGVARSTAKIGKKKKPGAAAAGGQESGALTVTDKRRVTETSDLSGPAPGMIFDGKKEKKIASLITDKPLYISFTFIPKVADVAVSVHRGDASGASRLSVPPADLPRMPEAIQKLIVEQLESGRGK